MKKIFLIATLFVIAILLQAQTYPIVDTGQTTFYNNTNEITDPSSGSGFYGQDATYQGNQPSYTDNGDGTVTDNVTGLMWQKSPDMDGDSDIDYNDKMSYSEALAGASTFDLAGYSDWRLPTIKEQYSLIIFSGIDPSGYEGTSTDGLVPFIDTNFFDFGYGDTSANERIIDAQYATSNIYVGTTMMGDETMFGVNFADGRIKGYPIGAMPGQTEDKQFFVTYVRGNSVYGTNSFVDNNNGTVTDNSTGLMWMQDDNGSGLNWLDALTYAEGTDFAGYSDWRLPNAKELQSIVDYTRAPSVTISAAIDPIFNCSQITDEGNETNYPFYWTGTTHANWTDTEGSAAAYVCFGEALGFMESPPMSGNYTLMDVHGAGSQRSDPKDGDPADYPNGNGPQGDVIRIFNYVRLVRDVAPNANQDDVNNIEKIQLNQNYPNPFNPDTTIDFYLTETVDVELNIYNLLGQKVKSLVNEIKQPGTHTIAWNGVDDSNRQVSSGIYFVKLQTADLTLSRKMVLMK